VAQKKTLSCLSCEWWNFTVCDANKLLSHTVHEEQSRAVHG